MPDLIQPSFSKGEVTPSIYGRVDTAAYQIALRKARNCIVHPHGGISNRPGTVQIGPVKDHTFAPRLIDFEFNTSDKYLLEFGNLYMRVIRNDGHVVEPTVTITDITQADPAVVTAASHGYSNGDEVFITDVVGMTQVNNRRFIVGVATTDTFQLLKQTTSVNIDSTGFSAYASAGTVARVFTLVTPYTFAQVMDLSVVQSANVMTIVHQSHAIRDLTRTDHHIWTLTQPALRPVMTHPTGITVTVNAAGTLTREYTVTAISATTGEESLQGTRTGSATISGATTANPIVITATAHGLSDLDDILITGMVGMTELNDRRFRVANKSANTFELENDAGLLEDGTGNGTYTSGGIAQRTFFKVTNSKGEGASMDNTISWNAVSGAVRYEVYKAENGFFGFIGETTKTIFEDGIATVSGGVTPNFSISPPQGTDPFRIAGQFPGAVSFHEQRKVFGGSLDEPDTTRYSQTGNFTNFSSSSPPQADDAITATLNSRQVNEIRHFVPGTDLLIFTSGTEWRVNPGQGVGFSATTLTQKPQSEWGIGRLRPILAGTNVLFVPDNGVSVRTLSFSFAQDAYTGNDLSILSSHFLDEFIINDWAYQRLPESRVYMIRSDGQVLTMTFNSEQEVVAWTIWDTDGDFERVGGLRHQPTETEDAIYFVVKRTINDETVRLIEKLHTRFLNDPADAFFLDAGISLDAPQAITGVIAGTPPVVTVVGHSFQVGDEVDVEGIEWEPTIDELGEEIFPTDLNGGRFFVIAITVNTVTLGVIETGGYDLSAISLDTSFVPGIGGPVSLTTAVLNATGDRLYTNASIFTDPISEAHIVQFNLSTPFKVDTAVDSGKKINIDASSADISSPRGAVLKPDGTTMFIMESADDGVYSFDFTTAFEIDTASYTGKTTGDLTTLIPGFTTNARDIAVKPDGTRMFIASTGDIIYQVDMSTAWDPSTASYSGVSFNVNAEETTMLGIAVGGCEDGTRIFISGGSGREINSYSMSTAWDLSTTSFDGETFNVSAQDNFPQGLNFANDGDSLIMAGDQNDIVFQWSLTGGSCTTPITVSAGAIWIAGGNVRKAVDTITGLDGLEGEDVAVLFDGHTHTNTIVNGSILLPRKASRVHVGKPFIAEIETLNLEEASGGGTISAREKKISKIVVRFKDSRGLLAGTDRDNLVEIKQREFEKLGEPTRLKTGDKEFSLLPRWTNHGRLFIRQKDPLPMTILAVIPDTELGNL